MNSNAEKKVRSRGARVLDILGFAFALYLVPFVIVVLDEMVFDTHWVGEHLPEWVSDAWRTLYPVHLLFE